jgi:protein-disulfide isomerase
VEKVSDWEKYLEFVDNVFGSGSVWWEWYSLDKLKSLVTKLKVDETRFNECYNNTENNTLVKKEFEQWLKLGINSTPASVIINNHTWEYTVLSWNITQKELESAVENFLNN